MSWPDVAAAAIATVQLLGLALIARGQVKVANEVHELDHDVRVAEGLDEREK